MVTIARVTTASATTDVRRRQDFVLLFDVEDGNPNGDPDAGNAPRMDPETLQGWVTDVSVKRKVRDYVHVVHEQEIYVKHRGVLALEQRRAFEASGSAPSATPNATARQFMCQTFYDVRMFGAVMTTGRSELRGKRWNCGQVRGPVQLGFARSVDPIAPVEVSLMRVARTNGISGGDDGVAMGEGALGQIARRTIVPYALYVCRGSFNPYLARDTGASEGDLELLWEALMRMWDQEMSATRGRMSCRGLYVFSHESPSGNAPAHALVERISVTRRDGVAAARRFADYEVMVDGAPLPRGVELHSLV